MVNNIDNRGTQGETGEQTPEVTTLVEEQPEGPNEEVQTLEAETSSLAERPDNLEQDIPVTEVDIDPFTSKVKERRETIRKSSEEVRNLLDLSEMEAPKPRSDITAEEVITQVKDLENDTDITPTEYILRSGTLLKAIEKVRGESEDKLNKVEIKWNELNEKVKANLQKRTKGFWFAKQKARRETDELLFEQQEISKEVITARNLKNNLSYNEKNITKQRNELLFNEVAKGISVITSEYEKIAEEILQNGTIPQEIDEANVKHITNPVFSNALEEDKQAIPEFINNFIRGMALDEIFPIVTGERRMYLQTINSSFGRTLVPSILPPDLPPNASLEELRENRRKHLVVIEDAFKEQRASNWKNIDSTQARLWNAMKTSKTSSFLFGDYISQKDPEVYEQIMNKSLSINEKERAGFIETLSYYPTPETIRNLVILLASDGGRENQQEVQWTLNHLRKQANWKQLFDIAETTYPSLKKTEGFLESHKSLLSHESLYIRSCVNDVAMDIIKDDNVNETLKILAIQSLQEVTLVNALTERGLLNKQEQDSILQAIAFLEKFPEEPMESVYNFYFFFTLREPLTSLLVDKSDEIDSQQLEVVKRFVIISDQILENKEDISALEYLTNGFVLKKSTDLTLTKSDLSSLFNAYKTIPILGKTYSLCESFCSQFEGEKSVTFLKELSDKFSNQENLTGLYSLVGRGEISQEMALKLPKELGEEIINSKNFKIFCEDSKLFLSTDKGIQSTKELVKTYKEKEFLLESAVRAISSKVITQKYALELPSLLNENIITSQNASVLFIYPDIFLKTKENIKFFEELVTKYEASKSMLQRIGRVIEYEGVSPERILEIPRPPVKDVVQIQNNVMMALSYPDLFLKTDKGVQLFEDLATASSWNHRVLSDMIEKIKILTKSNTVTQERILKIRELFGEDIVKTKSIAAVLEYPELFLQTDEGVKSFKKLFAAYDGESQLLEMVAKAIKKQEITYERALELPPLFGIFPQLSVSESSSAERERLLQRITGVLNFQNFTVALRYPKLFLDTNEKVESFKELAVVYSESISLFKNVAWLINKQEITQEYALKIPELFGVDITNSWHVEALETAFSFPKLFFNTNEGVLLYRYILEGNIFAMTKEHDIKIGKEVNTFRLREEDDFEELLFLLARKPLDRISAILDKEDSLLQSSEPLEEQKQILSKETKAELEKKGWQPLLIALVRSDLFTDELPVFSDSAIKKIQELFEDPKIRDVSLNGLREQWVNYLRAGKPGEIPLSLLFMSEFIDYCDGAGPLSQITSLNSLITSVNNAFSKETTVERTKFEIFEGLMEMENKFNDYKWSNNDRTDFYNISRDIIDAAPSIFSDYLTLFKSFSSIQLKEFADNIYPLYRTKLVLAESNEEGEAVFSRKALISMRSDIRNFTEKFAANTVTFEEERERLLVEISSLIKNRFGIIKFPELITSEHVESFSNISTYLSTIQGRTPEKEIILGFYLAIMINGRWDDFRAGVDINPDEYLVPENSDYIKTVLQERRRLNFLTAENLDIKPEEIPLFMELLQQEISNVVIGEIETVDKKLENVVQNLEGLADLDLYQDSLDKERMRLLIDYMQKEGGEKKLGDVIRKIWQWMDQGELEGFLETDEIEMKEKIFEIMKDLEIDTTKENLNKKFQAELRPFSAVISLMETVKGVDDDIKSLRELLQPPFSVIGIFNKLGEEFTQTSGVMALSQDIDHLENLVTKKGNELESEEREIVDEYLSDIRKRVVNLEEIYNKVKQKVNSQIPNVKKKTTNKLLLAKLDEISTNVNREAEQQVITSIVTNNLNVIIKNIRDCLSCIREGANNDTNLTFGDSNKFYLYSKTDTSKGRSIADQIIFIEPITKADGSKNIAFVFDQMYGTRAPTILENHIEVILKKVRIIKQQFPDIKLEVFIPKAAISTAGTSEEMLLKSFQEKNISGQVETVTVDVTQSATGDHYVEFGGEARVAGKREVGGVLFVI